MDIDFQKISQIYGNNIIFNIEEEMDNLVPNIKYLISLGFTNVGNIIELYPYLFITDSVEFKEKVNGLIKKIGIDYVEFLETNTDLWRCLDE